MDEASVEAARGAAQAAGLRVDAADVQVIYAGSSLIVGLGADGPVARVGGLTAGVRDVYDHYEREVRVARHLAAGGAPVVHPWEAAGPFIVSRRVVSLWQLADTSSPAAPEAAGPALRRCHDALRSFPGRLPPLRSLIAEAQRIVESIALTAEDRSLFAAAFAYSRDRLATLSLPEQAIHGDAGMGNVLSGGVWHDWEDCCHGPLIWDLASLVSSARILGRQPQRAQATLSAYGNAPGLELLDEFVAVRGLQVLAWSLLTSARERRQRASTEMRLRWFRAHDWSR